MDGLLQEAIFAITILQEARPFFNQNPPPMLQSPLQLIPARIYEQFPTRIAENNRYQTFDIGYAEIIVQQTQVHNNMLLMQSPVLN